MIFKHPFELENPFNGLVDNMHVGSYESFDSRMVLFGFSLGGYPFIELSKLLFNLKPFYYGLLDIGVVFHVPDH